MRETAADWIRGQEPKEEPTNKKKDKKKQDEPKIQVPRRNVGPSSTQVCCSSQVELYRLCSVISSTLFY